MISTELVLYTLLFAGGYLVIISLVLEAVGKGLQISQGIPAEMAEKMNVTWFVMTFVIELMFFVIIPVLAFGFFDAILPLTSVRTALAVALCAFTLGALPLVMGMSVRIKMPIPFLIFTLVGLLIKLGGTMAIIGYLYSL